MAMMIAYEKECVWGADILRMQEPVFKTEGCMISHPGLIIVRGKNDDRNKK